MPAPAPRLEWFTDARFGMFVHFGLYSVAARHEWVMNYEQIDPAAYRRYAEVFDPDLFDADSVARLADHYLLLLEAAVADPDARIGGVPLVDRDEREALLAFATAQW